MSIVEFHCQEGTGVITQYRPPIYNSKNKKNETTKHQVLEVLSKKSGFTEFKDFLGLWMLKDGRVAIDEGEKIHRLRRLEYCRRERCFREGDLIDNYDFNVYFPNTFGKEKDYKKHMEQLKVKARVRVSNKADSAMLELIENFFHGIDGAKHYSLTA